VQCERLIIQHSSHALGQQLCQFAAVDKLW
jgi:hypothetical protein